MKRGVDGQVATQRRRSLPTDDAAAEDVDGESHVDPARVRLQVRSAIHSRFGPEAWNWRSTRSAGRESVSSSASRPDHFERPVGLRCASGARRCSEPPECPPGSVGPRPFPPRRRKSSQRRLGRSPVSAARHADFEHTAGGTSLRSR